MTLGLFEKQIEGDDALLALARLRFEQAGMGAEMHAGAPEQLEQTLRFRPGRPAPVVVHLAREFSLADAPTRQRVLGFASQFAGRVYGLVLHDHAGLAERPEQFVETAREIQAGLQSIRDAPLLFIEYAAGLELSVFARFHEALRSLSRVSACIDIGHVGIWQTRQSYARRHPGEDVCALKSQPPGLPQLMPDVEAAVRSALPALLKLIERIGAFGKPVHFHLHDGHPLSTFSRWGVSDHLSFMAEIPLGFEYRGRRAAPLMYGPGGLGQIVTNALASIVPGGASFTLEIHPQAERLPLGDAAPLFTHWTDKTNAERMNAWLATLARNHTLLREACAV